MKKEKLLMTPGPTTVPSAVLAAGGEAMIHHRTPEYYQLFKKLNDKLKRVFQTQNPVVTFASSGTGGLEASVVNFLSPGDRVLCISIGVFGDRVADMAKTFGLVVDKLDVQLGWGVDPEIVAKKLAAEDYKAIFVTHNETSTGANNDIQAIGRLTKDRETLLIVDAVSSLGGLDLQTDNWGVDVVVTASQKALMGPPGLAFVSVSDKAWRAAEKSKMPKFYWDLLKARQSLEKPSPQNPYTPAVSLIRSANKALGLILEEGLQEVFARHTCLAEATRGAVEALGLELFANTNVRSDVITSVAMPDGIDGDEVKKIMSEKYGVIIAGGQQKLKGKIVRIGHMGYVTEGDVIQTIAAFEKALIDVGYPVDLGKGVKRALEILK